MFDANTTGIFSLAARRIASSFSESPVVPTTQGFFSSIAASANSSIASGSEKSTTTSASAKHVFGLSVIATPRGSIDASVPRSLPTKLLPVRTNPDATVVVSRPRISLRIITPILPPTPAIPIFNFDMFHTSMQADVIFLEFSFF